MVTLTTETTGTTETMATASNNEDNDNHHDGAFSDDEDDDNLRLVQTTKERNPNANASLRSVAVSKRRATSKGNAKSNSKSNAKKAANTPNDDNANIGNSAHSMISPSYDPTFMNVRSTGTMNPHVVPMRNIHTQSMSSSTLADPKAGKESSSFPFKLYQILSNLEFSQYITWLPHGRSWKVLDQKLFEEVVVPHYFRHKKFASFMRQVFNSRAVVAFLVLHYCTVTTDYYYKMHAN